MADLNYTSLSFEELWPDDDYSDRDDGGEFFRTSEEGPCVVCSRQTHWVSLAFEGRICGHRCSIAIWSDFAEASRLSDERYGQS